MQIIQTLEQNCYFYFFFFCFNNSTTRQKCDEKYIHIFKFLIVPDLIILSFLYLYFHKVSTNTMACHYRHDSGSGRAYRLLPA